MTLKAEILEELAHPQIRKFLIKALGHRNPHSISQALRELSRHKVTQFEERMQNICNLSLHYSVTFVPDILEMIEREKLRSTGYDDRYCLLEQLVGEAIERGDL